MDDRDPPQEPEEQFERHRGIRGGQATKLRRDAHIHPERGCSLGRSGGACACVPH